MEIIRKMAADRWVQIINKDNKAESKMVRKKNNVNVTVCKKETCRSNVFHKNDNVYCMLFLLIVALLALQLTII